MAVISISVFDTKAAADTFAGSLGGVTPKRYGPVSGFAFNREYGGVSQQTISHPKPGKYYFVIVEP